MKAALNGRAKPLNIRVAHRDDCLCPTCGSAVSPELYAAILGEQAVHDADIRQQAEAQFASREAAIRREATTAANAANAGKVAEAIEARKTAEQAVKNAKATFEAALKAQLDTQAEAAAKARVEAVNAVTEKFFGENLRLQERVLELQRMLEKKTANELGDAGEIDIFEALVAEFGTDQVSRVAKGTNGPDIALRVFANGVCLGIIVVEVKNHKRWSNTWVPKLRADMIGYGASHAVLVTATFPANEHQLSVRDGIVISSPARAIAVVNILRRAVVQFHVLRLSNQQRDEKTAQLYDLMVSDRATERWDRLSSATTELVGIESSDAAHQQRVRDKRLSKVRAIAAVHDEFVGDIEAIVRGEPEGLL